MHGEDGERQRRAHAVGADEGLEARPLVAGGEPVERERVLAYVQVRVQEDAIAELAEGDHRRRRDRRPVPDAADLHEHLARQRAVEQDAAQRADHRVTSRSRVASGATA